MTHLAQSANLLGESASGASRRRLDVLKQARSWRYSLQCIGRLRDSRTFQLTILNHYLALPHPQLLAPLDEADEFIFSISESELAHLLDTYRSLLPLAAHVEKDQGANGVSLRQKLSDSLLKHWLIQLILPFVMEWVLVLFQDLHRHPTTGNVSCGEYLVLDLMVVLTSVFGCLDCPALL